MTTLARNFSFTLLARIVSVATNVIYLAVTARLFTKQQVALIALGTIFAALLEMAKGLGLGTLLLKRLPKLKPSDPVAASLVLTFLVVSLVIPAVLGTFTSFTAPALCRWVLRDASFAGALRLSLALGVLSAFNNSTTLLMQAQRRFGWLAAQSLISSLAFRLAPCLIAFALGWTLESFLRLSCLLAAGGVLFGLIPVVSQLSIPRLKLLPWREFWLESRYFYLTGILRYGATQLDQVFVAAMFPPETLAVYYMLRRLYSAGVMFIDSVVDALVPDLSSSAAVNPAGAQAYLRAWSQRALWIGAVGGAMLAGNGLTVLGFLLGSAYAQQSLLVTLFAVNALLYFLFGLTQVGVMLFEEPRQTLALAGRTAACNSLLGPPLALLVGIAGIPLAMSFASAAGLIIARRRGSPSCSTSHIILAVAAIALSGLAAALVPPSTGVLARSLLANWFPLAVLCWGAAFFHHHRKARFAIESGFTLRTGNAVNRQEPGLAVSARPGLRSVQN